MATYYVRVDGNDSNTGTGQATNQAWATIQKALSATGISSGDVVYIAPGRYTEFVTVAIAKPTALTRIVGDPTSSQFTGVSAGEVLWSALNSSGTKILSNLLIYTSKNFLSFENFHFESSPQSGQQSSIRALTSSNSRFLRCQFTFVQSSNNNPLTITSNTGNALNLTIDSCTFFGSDAGAASLQITGQGVSDTSLIKDSLFIGFPSNCISTSNLQCSFVNNTFFSITASAIYQASGSVSFLSSFTNNLFINCGFGIYLQQSGIGTEDYNRFVGGGTSRTNFTTLGANSTTTGAYGLYGTYHLQQGLIYGQMFSTILGSVNTSFGTATGAPTSDIYGINWTGTSPDAGSATYRNLSGLGPYNPTERNASTITIAPASTSQSIELYLGATGLTASTSGLSARYNRTRTASVSIPLVARTIAQAWTSGGFAEVDATNMPGVYRLDIPDAALAAGADDVTIVVRGASGTNGAVMTVKLSSGGLTEAQTAGAVWNALSASYTAAGSMGARVLQTTVDNRPAEVGASNHIHANVHAIVDNTSAATELRGALLHNGTDYISADLLTPVSAATSVHIGPYQLLADGLGADQPLDVNVGTATSIDVQVTDANGTGIDITGATVTAKVYSSAGTLVATYSGTATYADNGRLSFGLTTTVTNTSGTYTVTVTRTTGATDTQIFGPLRLYVRPV